MNYLELPQHYEDRYDLHTIELCLERTELLKKIVKKILKSDKIDTYTDEELNRNLNLFCNEQILAIKLGRYKEREATIGEWYEEDRKKQDMYDNTSEPKDIVCDDCGKAMICNMKQLLDPLNKPNRMLFFFTCKNCKKNKAIYENGEIWKYDKPKCEKCGSSIDVNLKEEGDVTTWTYKCTHCDYNEVKVSDHGKWKKEREKRIKKEKMLLEKYREKYCLKDKEAKEYIDIFDELEFAHDVYKSELQKYKDPVYEKKHNLRKLSVGELSNLLTNKLEEEKYSNLVFKDPLIDQYVDIPFSIQQGDSSLSERESINNLKDLFKKILIKTTWRLKDNDLSYRLGFLTGELRGYERDEDILKILGKKKEKKIKLDPEKEKKYASSNAVGLAKLSAEFKTTERVRLKKYKKEGSGFFLNDGGEGYTCNVCKKIIDGHETWWIPEGILCADCRDSIENGVIPVEILRNDKIHFDKYDLERKFNLHHSTIRKLIRDGDLIARELKDKERRVYHRVFMVEDNAEFFKARPDENRQEWYYRDKKGNVVWV